MFYVDHRYQKIQDVFETLEEAVASARVDAGRDMEDYQFVVNEIKVVVKADRQPHPVQEVSVDEIIKLEEILPETH